MMLNETILSNSRFFFDFDNTITTSDVLDDIIKEFSINEDWLLLEKAWEEGRIGTKECLQGQLKNVWVSKKELRSFLKNIEIDPFFHPLLSFLRKEGTQPVILSDNFTFIIESILENHGIKNLPVYANRLDFFRDRLVPSFPYDNPLCPSCAHCKKIHLTPEKVAEKTIVYVGDGRSDLCPARVSDVVFAKDSLLKYLTQEGRSFIPYANLGNIYEYFEVSEGLVVERTSHYQLSPA